mgnify:CR=1 FL=1
MVVLLKYLWIINNFFVEFLKFYEFSKTAKYYGIQSQAEPTNISLFFLFFSPWTYAKVKTNKNLIQFRPKTRKEFPTQKFKLAMNAQEEQQHQENNRNSSNNSITSSSSCHKRQRVDKLSLQYLLHAAYAAYCTACHICRDAKYVAF